jgi:hypothetical protein
MAMITSLPTPAFFSSRRPERPFAVGLELRHFDAFPHKELIEKIASWHRKFLIVLGLLANARRAPQSPRFPGAQADD